MVTKFSEKLSEKIVLYLQSYMYSSLAVQYGATKNSLPFE